MVLEGVEMVGGGLISRFHPRGLPTCGGCLLLSINTLVSCNSHNMSNSDFLST